MWLIASAREVTKREKLSNDLLLFFPDILEISKFGK